MKSVKQTQMTHAELVEACRKIALDEGCYEPILDARRRWKQGEHPDAFASYSIHRVYQTDSGDTHDIYPGMTLVLEAKRSIGDFKADRKKKFRKPGTYALGDVRCYVAEEGVIGSEDIEDKWDWGLILIRPDGTHYMAVQPRRQRFVATQDAVHLFCLAFHDLIRSCSEYKSEGTKTTKKMSRRRLAIKDQKNREAILKLLSDEGECFLRDLISVCDTDIKASQPAKCDKYLNKKLGFVPVKGSSPTLYTYEDNKDRK